MGIWKRLMTMADELWPYRRALSPAPPFPPAPPSPTFEDLRDVAEDAAEEYFPKLTTRFCHECRDPFLVGDGGRPAVGIDSKFCSDECREQYLAPGVQPS